MDELAPEAEFDEYAADYSAALQEGLKFSGEDAQYFASARVQWVARRLMDLQVHPLSVLDFGCGTGASTPFFFTTLNVLEMIGIDVSPRLLQNAKRDHASPNATFALRKDYEPEGRVDLAFSNGVFHHIPPADRHEALEYVRRSLRPGGFFAFWENNPWNPGTRFVMSRIPFDRDAITIAPSEARRLLNAAGFQIIRTDYLFFFPRILGWLRPLETRISAVPLGAQYLVLCVKKAAQS